MFKSLKTIFICLAVLAGIILITLMILFGKSDREFTEATWNKLKPGDSIFAEASYLTEKGNFEQLHTFRLIRPINEADVNRMHVPDWQKLKLIAQLDTTAEHAKPVMIDYRIAFIQDSMFKNKTAFLGTYIRSDSVTGNYKEKIYIPLKWHVIKPNLALCDTTFAFKMPAGYNFADSSCYVDVKSLSLSQYSAFKTKK